MARSKKPEFKTPQIVVAALVIKFFPGVDPEFLDDVMERSGGTIYGIYFYDDSRIGTAKSSKVPFHFLRFEPEVDLRDTGEFLELERDLAEIGDVYKDQIGGPLTFTLAGLNRMSLKYPPIRFGPEPVTPSNEDEYDELMAEVQDVLESDTDMSSPLKAARVKSRSKHRPSKGTKR